MTPNVPRGRSVRGHVSVLKADSAFLGAEDLQGRGDVVVRIADVVEHRNVVLAGRKVKQAFALVYETRRGDQWQPGKKQWVLNATNRTTLARRFGPIVDAWIGQEITLFTTVVSGVGGGDTLGVRIRPTRDELRPDTYREQLRRVAQTDGWEEPAPEREPGADEDEPAPDDFDQRTDDLTEPPEG